MKVGIDFGTTTSTICRVSPDGNIDPQGPIPSIAAWKNGEWHFAEAAEALLAGSDRAAYPVRDLKLCLGKKSIRVGPHQLDTEEAVAAFLRYLAGRIAGKEKIDEAVIGTPVNVDLEHRAALLRAAAGAGFGATRLVYEPTSALLGATDLDALDPRSLVLVVDWGGGTLDLALVRRDGGLLREIEVDGDVHDLGGSRMDELIVRELLSKDAQLARLVDAVDGGFDRLKHEIEGTKRQILSEGVEEDSDGPYRLTPYWLEYQVDVYPSTVAAVIGQMAALGAKRIANFLLKSRINSRDVSHILFAGGVCNSPVVQDAISSRLPGARVVHAVSSPQLLTGYGCASLVRQGFSLQLASAFGVRQTDDTFCEMLPAGHDLAVGTYRVAEFMVTDVLAPEAVFDLGIVRYANGETPMATATSDGFRSMQQLFVPAQERPGQNKCNGGDLVRLFCGIDSTLAVSVYGESNLTGASSKKTVTGLPLAVRIEA